LLARRLDVRLDGFFFDGYWLIFAAGILLYRQLNYGGRLGLVLTWGLLGLGAAYSFRRLPRFSTLDEFLLTGFIFAGVLLVLHAYDRRLESSRALAPIRFLGTICYSLYLSHAVVVRSISTMFWDAGVTDPLVTALVVVPLCVVVAIAVGAGFHMLVERHFMTRPGAGAFAGPVGSIQVATPDPAKVTEARL
jgi:peptidoglycan/LPS O-acetylase OafA/YrhL